jgi:hypothetical protein
MQAHFRWVRAFWRQDDEVYWPTDRYRNQFNMDGAKSHEDAREGLLGMSVRLGTLYRIYGTK